MLGGVGAVGTVATVDLPTGDAAAVSAAPGERAPWRAWAGPLVTVAVSAVAQMVLVPVWVLLAMSLARYDDSGRGGPFQGCTADTTSCAGPNLAMTGALTALLLAVCALAARAGSGVGRYRRRRVAFLAHWGVGALAAVGTIGIAALVAGAPLG